MAILKRNEVKLAETWNLEDLFETEQQFEESIESAKQYAAATEAKYKGQITNAEKAIEVIAAYEAYLEK